MGKAVVMPSAASAAQMGWQTPRSSNVGLPGLAGSASLSSGWLAGAADSGADSVGRSGACGDCGVSVCAVRAVCFRQRPRCSALASRTSSQSRAWVFVVAGDDARQTFGAVASTQGAVLHLAPSRLPGKTRHMLAAFHRAAGSSLASPATRAGNDIPVALLGSARRLDIGARHGQRRGWQHRHGQRGH